MNVIRRSWWYLHWRRIRFWWQRRTRGWDDSETWNLDQQLATWLAPRLDRFRQIANGFPYGTTEESWDAELEEMCWAAKWYAENAYDHGGDSEARKRALAGLRQIVDNLSTLWW